jgi:hypothetical protein
MIGSEHDQNAEYRSGEKDISSSLNFKDQKSSIKS